MDAVMYLFSPREDYHLIHFTPIVQCVSNLFTIFSHKNKALLQWNFQDPISHFLYTFQNLYWAP